MAYNLFSGTNNNIAKDVVTQKNIQRPQSLASIKRGIKLII